MLRDEKGNEIGKAGNMVGRRTRHGNILSVFSKPNDPKTPMQQAQRGKQQPVQIFVQDTAEALKTLYLEKERTKKDLGYRNYYDAARSRLLLYAFDEVTPEVEDGGDGAAQKTFVFNPAKAIISKGSLQPPCNVRASYNYETGKIRFEWDDNSELMRAYESDRMAFLLYDFETRKEKFFYSKVYRSDKYYEADLDNQRHFGKFLLYAACLNPTRKLVSDSVCVGEVVIEQRGENGEMAKESNKKLDKQSDTSSTLDVMAIARNLKGMGLTAESIAEATGLSVASVNDL